MQTFKSSCSPLKSLHFIFSSTFLSTQATNVSWTHAIYSCWGNSNYEIFHFGAFVCFLGDSANEGICFHTDLYEMFQNMRERYYITCFFKNAAVKVIWNLTQTHGLNPSMVYVNYHNSSCAIICFSNLHNFIDRMKWGLHFNVATWDFIFIFFLYVWFFKLWKFYQYFISHRSALKASIKGE